MRSSDSTIAIRDKLQAVLPSVLAANALGDFDEYVTSNSTNVEKKSLCVYFSDQTKTYYLDKAMFIIKLQLYGILDPLKATKYMDVVSETVESQISPELVGFNRISEVGSDIWPSNEDESTQLVFITLEFESDKDGCDDEG